MQLHNRSSKAGFWTDSELLRWPLAKRFFYKSLWHLAEDSGCLEYDTLSFKIILFPSPMDSDITEALLAQYCDEMIQAGKLIPYTGPDGRPYLFIRRFHRHQRLTNCSKPTIPLPEWMVYQRPEKRGQGGTYTVLAPYNDEIDAMTDDERDGSYSPASSQLTASLPPASRQRQEPNLTKPNQTKPNLTVQAPPQEYGAAAPGEGREGVSPPALDGEDGAPCGSPEEVPRIKHDGEMIPITQVPGDRLTYLVTNGTSKDLRRKAAAELHRRDVEREAQRVARARGAPPPAPVERPSMRDDPEGYRAYVAEMRRQKGYDVQAQEDHGFAGLGAILKGGE